MISYWITIVWCGSSFPGWGSQGLGHKTNAGGRRTELHVPHPRVSTLQDALEICLPLLRVGGEGAAQALQVHQEQSERQAPGEACGKAPPGPCWGMVGVFWGYVGRPGTDGLSDTTSTPPVLSTAQRLRKTPLPLPLPLQWAQNGAEEGRDSASSFCYVFNCHTHFLMLGRIRDMLVEPWVGVGEARQKVTASLKKALGTVDRAWPGFVQNH